MVKVEISVGKIFYKRGQPAFKVVEVDSVICSARIKILQNGVISTPFKNQKYLWVGISEIRYWVDFCQMRETP